MTWLAELDREGEGCESLRDFIRHTTVPILVSKPTGEILWANSAFVAWSGFSLQELVKYGWKQITVPGDESDTDTQKATNWDAFTPIYTVHKQYYRKNQTAGWGTMTAIRFPPTGDQTNIQFCVVTWLPFEDATGEAMEIALKAISKAEKASESLTDAFLKFSQLSEEQKFLMTATQLAHKHPRITWAVITFGLTLFGVNNALEILKTFHLVPPTVIAQPQTPTTTP